jgi:diaminohydroxyphosphoribosylaminopyrimidine deaminase/5-amino-6-(5-phosphoribosylamino)uracil reductase
MERFSPVRVVLDAHLRLRPDSRLAATARATPVWVVAAPDASPQAAQVLQNLGVAVLHVPGRDARLDLDAALALLAARGITRLMVEGGPTVAAAFVAADRVDAAALFRSARTIGADGIDALEDLPLATLTRRLASVARAPVGDDSVEIFARP